MRLAAVLLLLCAQAGAGTLHFDRDVRNEVNGWKVRYYTVYRVAPGGRIFVVNLQALPSVRYSVELPRGCYFVTTWATLRDETEMRESAASPTRCTN